jgi:hypothetical protein
VRVVDPPRDIDEAARAADWTATFGEKK